MVLSYRKSVNKKGADYIIIISAPFFIYKLLFLVFVLNFCHHIHKNSFQNTGGKSRYQSSFANASYFSEIKSTFFILFCLSKLLIAKPICMFHNNI